MLIALLSIPLMIIGAILSIDGYNSMAAIWRDSNQGEMYLGIIILVVGIVMLLIGLVREITKNRNK